MVKWKTVGVHFVLCPSYVMFIADIDGIEQVPMIKNGGSSRRKNMVYHIDREHHIYPAIFGKIAVR